MAHRGVADEAAGEGPELCDVSQNDVTLVGRLPAPVDARVLPSGDEISSFRVVVARPPDALERRGPRAPRVDTIDCVVWRAALRRTTRGWRAGDVVELHGSLRRRFWRTPGGLASRYEVEVNAVRMVQRAPRPRAG